MMIKRRNRILSGVLAVLAALPLLCATALASGGPETETALPEPVPTPVPTIEPGEPLSEHTDIVTRDTLYDQATNKQFITIQDREGNVFYLIIDYDAPVDEHEEQFSTYFLNPVDASDLAALAKEEEKEPEVCICPTRCAPGMVNMNCPVCASNMAACMGKEPEPPKEEPETPQETDPEPEVTAPDLVILVLLIILVGGVGLFAFRQLTKKKHGAPTLQNPDDYDDPDGEEGDEDDDPWVRDEDDEKPGGDEG